MLSYRKRGILAGLESTYGVDAAPTAAIQCGDITMSPLKGSSVERKIISPSFGSSGSIRVENYASISFETEFAGAGVAGTAPPYANLLKACNFSETLTAAAISGTAQVGGSTTSIKLAAAASAIDDFYVGMSINITGGTASGQSGEIIDYVGSTRMAIVAVPWAVVPDGTSMYSIGANAMYIPNSTFGTTGNSSATLYFVMDGVRHIMLGARGTVKPDLSVKQIPSLKWEFTGLLGVIADVALPTFNFSAWQTPVTISTANTTNINLLGFADAVVETLSFDVGNEIVYRQLVRAESVIIKDRKVTGSLSIEATTLAEKDWWSQAKNATKGPFCVKHGTVAGNIVGITGPSVQLEEPDYAESDGVAMFKANMSFTRVVGNDEIRLCIK